MVNGRIVFDVFLLVVAGWAFSLARSFPAAFSPGEISSGFFPSIVSGLIILVMLNVLWTDLRNARLKVTNLEKLDLRSALGAVGIFVLLIFYVFFIQWVGFRIATMLFLFGAMLVCNVTLEPNDGRPLLSLRFTIISAISSVVISLATHAAFVHGFGLSLY